MGTSSGPGAVGSEELASVDWHISPRSNSNGGECVEAGPLRDGSGGSRCATATTPTTQ